MLHPIALFAPGMVAAALFAAQPAQEPDPTPLKGPDVTRNIDTEETDRDEKSRYRRGVDRSAADVPQGRMFKAMHKAFSTLASDDAPKELRLTETQAEKIASLRKEMRKAFKSGERPLREKRPMARAMNILNDDQREFVRKTIRERMQEIRGDRGPRGPRGMRRMQETRGDRADRLDPEDRKTVRMFRELSPEAKQRVRDYIAQEYKLQKQRKD